MRSKLGSHDFVAASLRRDSIHSGKLKPPTCEDLLQNSRFGRDLGRSAYVASRAYSPLIWFFAVAVAALLALGWRFESSRGPLSSMSIARGPAYRSVASPKGDHVLSSRFAMCAKPEELGDLPRQGRTICRFQKIRRERAHDEQARAGHAALHLSSPKCLRLCESRGRLALRADTAETRR
jgi:hypothetical protein